MNIRVGIRAALLFATLVASPVLAAEPLALSKGVHLLVDDHLISKSEHVERKVMQPQRFLKDPIVTGALEHQNWQPFFTVLYDPADTVGQAPRLSSPDNGQAGRLLYDSAASAEKRFRMWYNVDVLDDPRDGQWFGKTGLLASPDGIHWPGPYQRLNSLTEDGRVRFGASVIDDGPQHPVPAERYKMLYWDVGKYVGARVAFSPDGVEWSVHNGGQPILPKTPSDDIWTAGYDPLRKRYYLIGKHFGPHAWTNAQGEKLNVPIRRYFTSFSQDFKSWSDPEGFVFSPDEKDSGITQWYGAAGFQVRGNLIIGFLRELRDDLTPEGAPPEAIAANNGGGANLGANLLGSRGGSGMGYTVLTWTRDGVHWQRDRHTDKFFQPDPKVGAWDHAMAWVGSSVAVGDELYLYYAGYRWGHKYHHSTDRQIGLVKMQRDRYVARRAGDEPGKIVTPLVTIDAEALSLNVDSSKGEVRVQVTDADGKQLDGFSFADRRPISADSLSAVVEWKSPLSKLRGRTVRLEISLTNASLYTLEIQ